MPRDKAKPFAERRYAAVIKKFSRGRRGTRIVEILVDDGTRFSCRVWDSNAKCWRPKRVAKDSLISAPESTDPRWLDIRIDAATEITQAAGRERDREKQRLKKQRAKIVKRELGRSLRAAKRLLEKHGYSVEAPTAIADDDGF